MAYSPWPQHVHPSDPPIYKAAYMGEVACLEELIPLTQDINEYSSLGMTLLHLAIRGSQPQAVITLLAAGADPTLKDRRGGLRRYNYAAIDLAAHLGKHESLAVLMDSGVSITGSALAAAACVNEVKSLDMILNKVQLNDFSDMEHIAAVCDGLEQAARCWHPKAVATLFWHRANFPPTITDRGVYAHVLERSIIKAVSYFECDDKCRHPELLFQTERLKSTLGFLFEWHANVNFKCPETGYTPIQAALLSGYTVPKDVVSLFLENGLDSNSSFGMNRQPMLSGIVSDGTCAEIVKTMISKNADVNAKAADGTTPLHFASNEVIAELLVQQGAVVDARCKLGRTPLHMACKRGLTDMVSYLIDMAADYYALDQLNMTPLHLATMVESDNMIDDPGSRVDVVNLLIYHGADIRAKASNGYTPLHGAVRLMEDDLVTCLIEHEADVDALEELGNTPLHLLCSSGRGDVDCCDIARTLLNAGANLEARNLSGETPLQLAKKDFRQGETDNEELIKFLLRRGAQDTSSDDAEQQATPRERHDSNMEQEEPKEGVGDLHETIMA